MALTERRRLRRQDPWRSRLALHGFELLATINASPALTSTAESSLAALCAILGAPFAALYPLDPQTLILPVAHSAAAVPQRSCVEPGTPLAAMIMHSGETLVVSSAGHSFAEAHGYAREPIAIVAAPLMAGSKAIAVLSVEQSGARRWHRREVALVEAVAGALALAAERERQSSLGRRRGEHPAPRYSAATALIASLELPATLDSILEHATQMTGAAAAEIHLLRPESPTPQPAASYGTAPPHATKTLALPLEHAGLPLGMLFLTHAAPNSDFGAASIIGLRQFMRYAASAIVNAQAHAAAQAANRHKSEFIATVSHELRTPMGAIMGYAELLAGGSYGDLPPSMRDPLLRLKTNADSLLTLINQMLDLSRIEAGRLELHAEPFHPQDLLHAIAAPLVPAPGVSFMHTITPDLPRIVLGDVGRLRQLLGNLLTYSLTSTTAGSVVLACARSAEGELEFSVTDTGPGIAPDRLAFIWEPFRQLGPTESRVASGAGLGLAIVQKLAQLMGGSATVTSRLGQGTRFTVRLPLRVP